jgi:parvulin-like peptidyl-prolyl isomerase
MKQNQIITLLAIAIIIVAVLVVWAVFFYNPSSQNHSSSNADKSKIILEVGKYKVTENRLQIEIENMKRYGYQPAPDSTDDEIASFEERIREQAIMNLTDFYLVLLYASDNKLETITDEQIDSRISEVLIQSGLNLDQYLSEGRITEEEFRTQVNNQLIFERVLDPLSAEVPEPTDKELQDHFNQNRQSYVMPETVEYEQLVVADMKTCKEVLGLLNSGREFSELVPKYSKNQAIIESEGLMPLMSKSDIPIPAISDALFPPYEGYENAAKENIPMYIEVESSGFFIINLLHRNPSQSPEFDETLDIYDSRNGEMKKTPIKDKVYSDWKSMKHRMITSEFIQDLYRQYEGSIVDHR